MKLRTTMMHALLLVVCALPIAAPAAVPSVTAQQAAKNAVEHYFQPGYRTLLTKARAAEKHIGTLCESPNAEHLAAARAGFGALVAAWSRIEIVRFGPVLRDNRLERILFSPDRRGIGLRQVQALLAGKDESATSPDTLHAKSVAVQGLTALEYVLFGTDANDLTRSPNSFRCRYGAAIAGNIGNIAENLHRQWTAADGIAAQITRPGPDNALYRNDQEVLGEIVGVLAHGFETIRDTRLKPILGTNATHARPKAALFWRSRQTMPAIAANFAGLQALYDTSRIGDTLREDPDGLAKSIHTEFGNAAKLLATVTPDVASAVTDKTGRDEGRGRLSVHPQPAGAHRPRTGGRARPVGRLLLVGRRLIVLLDRRTFLQACGVAFVAGLDPLRALALEASDAVFVAACKRADGRHAAALFTERGDILHVEDCPGRAHDVTVCPASGRVAAFARRPGTFALVFDPKETREPVVITSAPGRHFYGHGAFSPDGHLMYATENDFDAARGVVGVYDATDGFKRIGEFDSHGVGPHELLLTDNGRTMVVANGGIETHPDYGRAKLNLDRMQPSIAFLEAATGRLIEQHGCEQRWRQLSMRHLAFDGRGDLWFGCQYQGRAGDRPPLIGRIRRGGEARLIALPEPQQHAMRNYIGSVAASRDGTHLAFSAPRGGVIVVTDTNGRLLETFALRAGCGIVAVDDSFLATSGDGRIARLDEGRPPVSTDLLWDHHIARVS